MHRARRRRLDEINCVLKLKHIVNAVAGADPGMQPPPRLQTPSLYKTAGETVLALLKTA